MTKNSNITIPYSSIKILLDIQKVYQMSVRQLAIKDNCNYAPTSLGNLLREDDTNDRTIRANSWKKILDGFRIIYFRKLQSQGMNEDLNKVHLMLLSLEFDIEKDKEIIIQAPGGPISWNALNYISRDSDNKLDSLLKANSSPLIAIIGGLQYGKSSAFNRFEYKVNINDSYKFIKIDFGKIHYHKHFDGLSGKVSKSDIFYVIIDYIYEQLKRPLNVSAEEINDGLIEGRAPNIWALIKLETLLEEIRKEGTLKKLFIGFDSVERLFNKIFPKQTEEANSFLFWVGEIRWSSDQIPWHLLSIVISLSSKTYSSEYSSVIRNQGHGVRISKLSKENIVTLSEIYGVDIKENVNKLYELFNGHPFLTHCFIYDLSIGNSFIEIENSVYELESNYGIYSRNVLKAIKDMIQEKKDTISISDFAEEMLKEGDSTGMVKHRYHDNLFLLGIVNNQNLLSPYMETVFKHLINSYL